METMKVVATLRSDTRKGPARRLRGQGLIPAVAYGRELAATNLVVSPKDVNTVLASEFGRNTVIELQLEDKTAMVLLSDYQYHPVTRQLIHADFRQIRMDQPVEVEVPFELVGRAKGVVEGGVLRQVFRRLPVSCLPSQIPSRIEHDATELELDQHVAVQDLSLPEGVSVLLPATQTVAAVVTVKEVAVAEEEAAAEAAAEGEKPAEAAGEEKAGPAEGQSKPES